MPCGSKCGIQTIVALLDSQSLESLAYSHLGSTVEIKGSGTIAQKKITKFGKNTSDFIILGIAD
jgi:hypothetical protein